MSGRQQLLGLRHAAPAILPSMLLCDFSNLEREVHRLEAAGVKALHLDVMDGVFVPNLTYGLPIVSAFRRLTKLPLDVHLMIADPQRYLGEFVEAGADILTVHAEAVRDLPNVLQQIRDLGAAAGVAVNPQTSLDSLEKCWHLCDLVLVMSVPAGFGGQAFQPVALEKLRTARLRAGDQMLLEVDGGVNQETIAACAEAGADLFVVGSAIFRSNDYEAALTGLSELVAS